MCRLTLVLIFMLFQARLNGAFDVHFHTSYPSQRLASDEPMSHLYKRDMQQFYDKATYTFDGLNRIASVPVPYPLDICMLQLPRLKYATALYKDKSGLRHFAIYVWQQQPAAYQLLLDQATPAAIALDCLTYAGRGYVAITYNLTQPIQEAREGSPIYELSQETGIRTVQYFAAMHLRSMYLRISSQELTLLQAYDAMAAQKHCPYFKWTGGTTFQRLGSIPCSNARRLEAFGIDYADYVAVANYADDAGRTDTHSEIYKYNGARRKFELFQRLRSNGAVDIKYFSVPINEVSRRHFLVVGNTVGRTRGSEADAVFYVYERGQFVPYQRLAFYAVERFLPVQHVISEKFLLLVACNKQDVKIYNLNDWNFEESTVQFTEGAFSKGVARMRSYEEGDQSYLVIANELMAANETNIFQALYKQDEHANALRQEMIEWAHAQTQRLQGINLEHLLSNVQEKVKPQNAEPADLQNVNIKQVDTKYLLDEHNHLTANYWNALSYAKRALDIIEHDARVLMTPGRVKRQTPHEFEEISVDTLLVRDKLQAGHINGINTEMPVYQLINASKVYVSGQYNETNRHLEQEPQQLELNVQSLHLLGKLNGLNWTRLQQLTLKRSGSEVQFIKAPAVISNLAAEAVIINSNKVNDQSLAQLVSIDGGDYIVQQDVQFAKPLKVQSLQINQRLNNIHVDRERFDVLLKNANYTQVIEGAKRFERIRVLEPITMAGQMLGAKLRAMSPMKVIHQSLQLQGDYVIDGNAIIGELLRASDLVNAQTQSSSAATLAQGISLKQNINNVNLRFEQPLKANQTQLSFINAQDLQHLVKLNVDEVQVVQAHKRLPETLHISKGFAEVKWLNGVDVEQLPHQLLLRQGNQTIHMPMQLGELRVQQLQADEVQLNGKTLAQYMNRNGNQNSNAALYVGSLQTQELNVQELHANGAIFGHNLSDIYRQDKPAYALPPNFAGTLQATNVWLKTHINDVPVAAVEQRLQQLAGNVKYVGDFSFEHAMNISELRFGGTLNGLAAEDFGRCWLETSGEQNFTAPQTLARMDSVEGILLQGSLNNYTLQQYWTNTYRLNESQMLPAVTFENPIVLQSGLEVQLVNGLRLPEDMLYASANETIQLQAPLTINAALLATTQCHVNKMNGIPLQSLSSYLNAADPDTLHVEHALFAAPPSFDSLNGRQLQRLLNEVWLANEQIELNGVQLASASFEGLLQFEGNVNGLNLDHIKRNYFSRTRSQLINVALNFAHDVTVAQPLYAGNVHLHGALVEGIGNTTLDFNAFVANTLKTAGPHNISAQWSMLKAHVPGDLNFVLLNGLNLVNDVLRNDTEGSVFINGTKRVKNAAVKRLYATGSSSVANVPVVQWINDAVYTYGNHSIPGTTVLETVNVYNDVCVAGKVNGIDWQADKLLLRDAEQQLAGELHVQNTLPMEQRILTNNIEDLLVNEINALSVNELLVNKARNRPNLHVQSQLIFTQPLTVSNYEYEDSDKLKREAETTAKQDWQQLAASAAQLQQRLANPPHVLENFALLQQLQFNASYVDMLTYQNMDVLAIWSGRNQSMDYFVWQPAQQIFTHNETLSLLLPQNKTHLQLYKAGFQQALNKFDKADAGLWHLQQLGCLAWSNDARVRIECIDKASRMLTASSRIKQLLPLDQDAGNTLALLCLHAVEFWQWHANNNSYTLQRRLNVLHAQSMELATHEERNYLAVLTRPPAKQLLSTIEIYSSGHSNSNDYQFQQSIHFDASTQPQQLRFLPLPKSNDLLLCVSTSSQTQPLRIYQHQGIVGFQQVLGASTLPDAPHSLHVLQLQASQLQLLAFVAPDVVLLLQPQLNSL